MHFSHPFLDSDQHLRHLSLKGFSYKGMTPHGSFDEITRNFLIQKYQITYNHLSLAILDLILTKAELRISLDRLYLICLKLEQEETLTETEI